MSDKSKHIDYWKTTSMDDLGAIDLLLNGKKYVQALFFMHLALEKTLKAHWVKDNAGNVPPKTHNLTYLFGKTNLNLPEEDTDFLQTMNIFQMEGRYPDYLAKLHQTTQKTEAEHIISQAKQLLQCLHEKL